MELYLLRHGIAAELDETKLHKDSERPLTAEGRKKLGEVARAMGRMELDFDLILTSPFVRARETAEILATELRLRKLLRECPALEPGSDFQELARELQDEEAESVLLVGHEPYLSDLISWLVAGKTGCGVTMKKGGLCRLSADGLRSGTAALQWLLTPKQMRLMN